MIVEAMTLLLTGLNQHIHAQDGNPIGTADVAIPGSPAQTADPDAGPALENQVLLTVLNIEEEAALKNGQTAFREGVSVAVRHRAVHLNLFLVFSANFANYATALSRLGQVVTYFQSHKRFEPSSFPGLLAGLPADAELTLTVELVTLNLEELNHIWGALGGRALPFAAYRARLVVIREDSAAGEAGTVRDIRAGLRDTLVERV